MNIRIVFEKADGGAYTVYVPSLPGCISEGGSKEEAIELYLEPVEDEMLQYENNDFEELVV